MKSGTTAHAALQLNLKPTSTPTVDTPSALRAMPQASAISVAEDVIDDLPTNGRRLHGSTLAADFGHAAL